MDATNTYHPLPDSSSPLLFVTNATPEETQQILTHSYPNWGDALTLPEYLEEVLVLGETPLAHNNGMQIWILTIKDSTPNHRPILASCETIRKNALVINNAGEEREGLIYGVAHVFVNPAYRLRGYAARQMRELASMMPEWHVGSLESHGSVLFSEIGKTFYSPFGWPAWTPNAHLEFRAEEEVDSDALLGYSHPLEKEDVPQLCEEDKALRLAALAKGEPGGPTRVMTVPDAEHMMWHFAKAEYPSEKIFGCLPSIKGAMAGERGSRVWVTWKHTWHRHPSVPIDKEAPVENVLYILRLVIENRNPKLEQLDQLAENLRCVLHAAQVEAGRWQLECVRLWNPTPLVQDLVGRIGIENTLIERQTDEIASLNWWQQIEAEEKDNVEWVACEKYVWC